MKRCNRTLSLLLIVLVLLCAAGVSAGEAFYKWVPEEFSEPYPLDLAEYRSLKITAHHNNESYLTEKLVKTGFEVFALQETLYVSVCTKCQPTWATYTGKGSFSVSDRELRAAYEEAGVELMKTVQMYFPGLDKERVVVNFSVMGTPVGVCHNGVMKLQGE